MKGSELTNQTIRVWQIPLLVSDDVVRTYSQCLSGDERSRADRFRFDRDRRRFVVARGTLRHLLAKELSRVPEEISFCYGEFGKPSVAIEPVSNGIQSMTAQSASGACDFHFNISHSGEIALCALGNQQRVGIDIEKIKDIQRLDSMTERCLLPSEQAEVESADDSLRAFLQRWTCKEAYLKAIGMGLIQSMKTVEVELAPSRFVSVPQGRTDDWALSLVDVPDDYVAAVTIERPTETRQKKPNATVEKLLWQH